MKIYLIDMLGGKSPDLGFQIKTACEHLGHSVKVFNYRKFKLQHFSLTNRFLNKLMVQGAVGWGADLVLVNKGETILPGTISKIEQQGIKTANWCPDEPFGYLQSFNKIKNVPEYSAFFIYDRKYVKPLRELNPNSQWLPPGADPLGVHKETIPLSKRVFPYDLCMVGTAYPNRISLMRSQLNRKLCIAGPGWRKAKIGKTLPHIKITEMVSLFNKSKIVLNPYGASKHFIVPNPRTFEIPSTKSFQLTDIPADVDKFFVRKKEIVTYKGEGEFRELVEYYLENYEERNKIAIAGYKRVLKEHTMKHRVAELLKKI